jgi:hypothetical protein
MSANTYNNMTTEEKIMGYSLNKIRILGMNLKIENAYTMNKKTLYTKMTELIKNGDLTDDFFPIKYDIPTEWDKMTPVHILTCLNIPELKHLLDTYSFDAVSLYPMDSNSKFDDKKARRTLKTLIKPSDFPIVLMSFADKWAKADAVGKLSLHGIDKLKILAKNKDIEYEDKTKKELVDLLTPVVDNFDYPITDEESNDDF